MRGVGRAGGFKIMIEDRGDLGMTALQEQTDRLAAAGPSDAGPGRAGFRLPGQRAAALRRRGTQRGPSKSMCR